MSEQTRLTYEAAQHPAGPSPAEAAYAEHQARLAADEAQLRTGGPHSDEVMSYHEGRPTVREQMSSHGAAPPKIPDVGGHG
jgi:hypothetical protein